MHTLFRKGSHFLVGFLCANASTCRISWARIFPFGTADSPVNKAAIDHYSDRRWSWFSKLLALTHLIVIDYHIKFGVEPVATLCKFT